MHVASRSVKLKIHIPRKGKSRNTYKCCQRHA